VTPDSEPSVGRWTGGGIVERVIPAALGREYRWLWSQTAITNMGDGILLAAGPLLVTTITLEPFAVALAVFLQQLPWVVFGVPAGAVIDRVDRRRLVVVVNVLRALVLIVLAASVATGTAGLPIVYGAVFLIGTAETFSDNAGGALLATYVPTARLGVANARLTGTSIVTNQLVGPPIGALLFTAGMAIPFGIDAVCALLGAALIARIAARRPAMPLAGSDPIELTDRPHLRQEMADGVRWLWHHRPLRALALTIFFFNVTFHAGMAVFVLYATEHLGLGDVGFGLLLTVGAIGGLIGSAFYGHLERRFSLATIMRGGLVIETLTHLVLALTTSAIVAGATMLLFGIHAVAWGTTATTVRQRAVPEGLLGRVTGVYMLGAFGGGLIGTLVGGLIAQRFGLTAPFWFGFFGSAVLLVVIWGTLADIAHAPTAVAEPRS
jgi:MFS family permease